MSNEAQKQKREPAYSIVLTSSSLLKVLAFSGIFMLALIALSFQQALQGSDSGSCRGVYMSPAYARVYGFDESHTRFASKYLLYLYREQGRDPLPEENDEINDASGIPDTDADPDSRAGNAGFRLTGTPVLFIPGNAGSYKQVRSIAAKAAGLFYDNKEQIEALNGNVTSLDFFSADFNGDFTAFHGRTMLDQSEYLNDAVRFILSLYRYNENPARSVILLGHSMGGVVARVMLTLPNYTKGSVNTIITLAAPHAAAPATFDKELLDLFTATDNYWRLGYSNMSIATKFDAKMTSSGQMLALEAHERLQDVTLLSITGGILDTTLPADYTVLTGLVPDSNGLTVATSGIPGVWTPMDHLAIVWCDQLREILAQTLLQVTDVSMRTIPRSRRMSIFRQNFVESADPLSEESLDSFPWFGLKIDLKQLKDSARERSFQLPLSKQKRSLGSPSIHMFHLPETRRRDESGEINKSNGKSGGKGDCKGRGKNGSSDRNRNSGRMKFNLISSIQPTRMDELSSGSAPAVLLCRTISEQAAQAGRTDRYAAIFDYTTHSTSQFVQLECLDMQQAVRMIPRSYLDTKSTEESSIGGPSSPFYFLELTAGSLEGFNTVIIAESDVSFGSDDFFLADLESEESTHVSLGRKSLWTLLSRGYDLTLPSHRPLAIDIDVPSARSSLLTYNLDIKYHKSPLERFSPLLSQSAGDETKWHINLGGQGHISARIMGVSPFVPYNRSSTHLRLKLFADTFAPDEIMDVYISIDWFKSLHNLVMQYRLAIVGLPVFVVAVVLFLQLRQYLTKGVFPSFSASLLQFCSPDILAPVLFFISVLSWLTSRPLVQTFLNMLDPVKTPSRELMRAIGGPDLALDECFLGIGESSLWFYGPCALAIAVAMVSTLNFLVTLVCKAVILLCVRLRTLFLSPRINLTLHPGSWVGNGRRTVAVILLMTLVLVYFPYQFAFVACYFTRMFVVLKSQVQAAFGLLGQKSRAGGLVKREMVKDEEQESKSSVNPAPASSASALENYKNFNLSLFLLMTWILPINIPVMVVWVHNFSVKWATPFSSHHNLLTVLPTVLLVQMNNSGCIFSPASVKSLKLVTSLVVLYLAFYSLLFGTRHLFLLHYLFNLLCAWFLVLLFFDFVHSRQWTLAGTRQRFDKIH